MSGYFSWVHLASPFHQVSVSALSAIFLANLADWTFIVQFTVSV